MSEEKQNSGMGCYEHPERTVVATCSKCGKFMCKECAEKYESKLCEACEQERIKAESEKNAKEKEDLKNASESNVKMSKKELTSVLIKTGIGAAIGLFIGLEAGSIGMVLVYMYMFGGFPWGWKYVKDAIDTGDWAWLAFAGNSIWYLVFGIFLKLLLAILIGLVAMPMGIFKAVKNFNTAKNLDKEVNEQTK